jgi:predicted dehydrogenase
VSTHNKEIMLAQLGCGYWGPNLLRNFSSQDGCRVKWVADENPARRTYVESSFPASQTTDDWRVAINDPDVDGVVVSTPAASHYALTKAALEAGKHVFVEKPLATSTAEADDLIRIAANRGLVLMVGHTFLYNDAVRYTKNLVESGDLGDVYYMYSQRLNLGQVRRDVNAWWNLAPHDISIFLYMMDGELPATIAAHGSAYIQPDVEDVVFATLTWKSGITANVQVSWLDPGKVRKMTIVGSRKMVVYDDILDDKIAIVDKGIDRVPRAGERMDYDDKDSSNVQLLHRFGDILLPRITVREPLKVESGHFVDCIRTGETPMTGPRHGRDVVAVLEAGQQSLKQGGSVVEIASLVGVA